MTALSDAVSISFWSLMAGVHTCLPGRIESYSNQKANVKPLIQKKYLNGEIVSLPVISNVPIVFPRSESVGITFPIKKGDGCIILFSERSMERWLSSGDDVEPGDSRKFDLSDAIAIPGLYSFNKLPLSSNNDDVEIHHSGQKITIKKNGDIEIGSENLLKLVNENFKSIFNSHVHNVSVSGTPAAQSGTTSSPTKAVGVNPIAVPPSPVPPTNLFAEEISNSELTLKTKVQ